MIHTFVTTFQNKAPEFKDVRYDFNRREFVGRLGKPVDRATFQQEAREGAGRVGRAGEATARRGILIQSLVSSESRERPGILEQVLNRARALVLEGNLDRSFSRQPQKATSTGGFFVSGLPRAQISAVVEAITRAWKNAPEIVIVEDMNDPAIPEAVRLENQRQLSQGATGQPEGFFAGGRVYIVASQIERPGDVARVLLHESLGHYGLRGLYGEGLNKILKQIAALRRGDVEAMARRYGLDMENEADRLQAAEEVLAHLAQTRPESGFVQRAIAAIRAWLRENIPGFGKMKLSDGEIIEHFLLPARRFVEQGGVAAPGELAGAFSRTARTRSAYEKRIDELFRGAASNSIGVRVMDRSDVLSMLGYPSGPVLLRERKVKDGLRNHPRMTAEHWKKVPEWLDSPALVFDSDTIPGRIVFFAPEQLQDGTPIMMVLEPSAPKKGGGMTVSLLVNAYDRISMPLGNWIDKGLLRYYDKEKSPVLVDRSGLYMTSLSQARSFKGRIYTDADLVKYRKDNPFNPNVRFSRSVAAQFANAANRTANVAPVASVAPAAPSPGGGLTPWRDRMDRIADSLIYNFQDRFKPLRDIQKRMVPAREEEDAVLAEERYSGIVRARTDDFHADLRDPLIEAIHDGKLAWEEVEEYLHARHAPSRNAAMREINPTEEEITDRTAGLENKRDLLAQMPMREYVKARRDLRAAEADIEDGVADESLSRVISRELERLQKMDAVRDYRDTLEGLRALRHARPFEGDNTALSGMSNDEAAAVMQKARASGRREALERVSSLVDRINISIKSLGACSTLSAKIHIPSSCNVFFQGIESN